eukprot:TRINITY_DN12882_c0_g1_i2.p1 TRINITY_DN12882_c0_g1~~TRINITY_DN12882_c0_g1_i2.p1  ORF type:complete len:559 (+),score=76.16 TRINITY_DN12882_c0_g1_i2:375-2051(+)
MKSLNAQLDELTQTTKSMKERGDRQDEEMQAAIDTTPLRHHHTDHTETDPFLWQQSPNPHPHPHEGADGFLRQQIDLNQNRRLVDEVSTMPRASQPRLSTRYKTFHPEALDALVMSHTSVPFNPESQLVPHTRRMDPMQASGQRYRESMPNTGSRASRQEPTMDNQSLVVRGQSTPHEHNVTPSWMRAADAKLEAQEASGKLRQTIVGVKHAERVLEAEAQAVVAAANASVETTREHFQALHRALAAREDEIVNEIQEECGHQLTAINHKKQDTSNTLSQADVAYGVADAIIRADDDEVLNESPAMRHWACMVPPTDTLSTQTLSNIQRLIPLLDKSLLKVLSSHGSLPRASNPCRHSPQPPQSPPTPPTHTPPPVRPPVSASQLSPRVADSIRSAMRVYMDAEPNNLPTPSDSQLDKPSSRVSSSPGRVQSPITPSPKKKLWDHSGTPPPRPTPVKCTQDSVTLVWDAAPQNPTDPIPVYRMEYTCCPNQPNADTDAEPAPVEVVDGNRSRVCTIHRLEPNMSYRFRVRAEIGSNQWSKPSEWSELVQLGHRSFYLI